MAPDPYRRMNGNASTGSHSWTPPDSSHQRLQLDNLLRRELKVANPSDAKQIASALLERYKGAPRARAIEQEARGLPFLQLPTVTAPVVVPQTSSSAELQQALDDVERDLKELTTNSLLKDVTPELEGWAQGIRTASTEGANAARYGLDPRQRDKAMAIRRQLGDYARMARLVGALTPTLNLPYRKLAQSCDEVGSVLLVMIGEALANIGFNGGQFLLQVPHTELQVRRDAAIYALRNLVGATQEAYGPSDWPRGLNAYRRLFETLERQGRGDLRALLMETELARAMDALIHRAGQGSAEGLRAIGATAQLELERFHRLADFGQSAVSPESPPLTTFLESLRLFADAFTAAGGYRLLRIARPPILFYGLYDANGIDAAEQRLLELVLLRGQIASAIDCFLGCGCTGASVRWLVAFDMALYQLDRAIDLYAVGTDLLGEPERRAAAYGFVIDQLTLLANDPLYQPVPIESAAIVALLARLGQILRPDLRLTVPDIASLRDALVEVAQRVIARLTASGLPIPADLAAVPNLPVAPATAPFALFVQAHNAIEDSQTALDQAQRRRVRGSATVARWLGILHDELCVQRRIEERWEDLVLAITPGCGDPEGVLEANLVVLDNAIAAIGGPCQPIEVTLPPDLETAFDSFLHSTPPSGLGRLP